MPFRPVPSRPVPCHAGGVFIHSLILQRSMMRSNLVKLMAGPSPESEAAGDTKNGGDNAGDEKRRRLIVDLDPPRFGRFTGLLDVPGTLLGWADNRYGGSNNINNDQQGASADGALGIGVL